MKSKKNWNEMTPFEKYNEFKNSVDDDSDIDTIKNEEECRIAREEDAALPIEDFSHFFKSN